MQVRSDGQALVTGSADKDVKFWEFERQESAAAYMVCLPHFPSVTTGLILYEAYVYQIDNSRANVEDDGRRPVRSI